MNDTAKEQVKDAKTDAPKTDIRPRDLSRRVASACILRFEHQEYKGKFRDKAALEFVLGAMATVDPDSPSFKMLGILAMLISVRGYHVLKEWVKYGD